MTSGCFLVFIKMLLQVRQTSVMLFQLMLLLLEWTSKLCISPVLFANKTLSSTAQLSSSRQNPPHKYLVFISLEKSKQLNSTLRIYYTIHHFLPKVWVWHFCLNLSLNIHNEGTKFRISFLVTLNVFKELSDFEVLLLWRKQRYFFPN